VARLPEWRPVSRGRARGGAGAPGGASGAIATRRSRL